MIANKVYFKPCYPEEWKGRYLRIPGETTAFYVNRFAGRWTIRTSVKTGDLRLDYYVLQSSASKKLVEAINFAKRRQTGINGGSFLINEFGQVLVPTKNGPRFYVGEVKGTLLFRNPGTKEMIDLTDDSGLQIGDPWGKPYAGTKYKLSARSEIYYWDRLEDMSIKPPMQDRDLISRLRKIRSYGSLSFVVNPYGLVLVKGQEGGFQFDGDNWRPIYAGRLDYAQWYEREEMAECRASS